MSGLGKSMVRLGGAALVALTLAACQKPSERYGLTPIDTTQAYPDIGNRPPPRPDHVMTSAEAAAQQAALERKARGLAAVPAARIKTP